jgi:hypothetical protein
MLLVVGYWRTAWPIKVVQIGILETSLTKYQLTPRNITEGPKTSSTLRQKPENSYRRTSLTQPTILSGGEEMSHRIQSNPKIQCYVQMRLLLNYTQGSWVHSIINIIPSHPTLSKLGSRLSFVKSLANQHALFLIAFFFHFSRCCDKKSCGNRNETPSDPVIIDR